MLYGHIKIPWAYFAREDICSYLRRPSIYALLFGWVGFGACLGFTLRPHCQDFLRICGTIPISSSNMGFTRAWAPMPKDISLTLGWCVLLAWFAGCFAEWHNFRCYPMCWSNVRSAVWSQMCFLCCRFVGARSLLI